MLKSEAIKKAGSAANLARMLGVTRQAVNRYGKYLPEGRVWQLRVTHPEWFIDEKEELFEGVAND